MPSSSVSVALSNDFLKSFSRLPAQQQKKVRAFIEKFKKDPMSPGINYEKIQRFRDPNLRSVRIDQAYRGIVHKPAQGKVYMLLWVAHHDEAYAWAQNRRFEINPETGSIQILEITEAEEHGAAHVKEPSQEGLFATLRDKDLLKLGVPAFLIPSVRQLKDESDLDRAAEHLPADAYESLFYLSSGMPLDEVLRDRDFAGQDQTVDQHDFLKALQHPDSQRNFVLIDNDEALERMLSAPLDGWRVFLHPMQRRLVQWEVNGPIRVLGGAGTGKTVVAMHRARWLAEEVFNKPGDRILFTTYTANLAADILQNLQRICSVEALRRIEVVHLDKWAIRFLKNQGYAYEIDFGQRRDACWNDALNLAPEGTPFDPQFYRDELDNVILPHGITTFQEYMVVRRLGRGQRLTRKMRKAIWPVFEEYRLLLNERGLKERDDALRDARHLIEHKGITLPYRSVIVDEAQDMSAQALRMLRALVPKKPHDLFIVGDAHQRIYQHKVVLSHCGINIRGRSRKLRINYRTTEENRAWAERILAGWPIDDLDGGLDDQKGYTSLMHGVVPQIRPHDTFANEVSDVAGEIKALLADGTDARSICIVARTHKLLDQYEGALKIHGVQIYQVKRSQPDDPNKIGVRLATMHRVKGLEFEHVFIVGVNTDVVPLTVSVGLDEVSHVAHETRERALLYVSATRAKKSMMLTSHGVPSPFL